MEPPSQTIVVLGATGTQGGSVVSTFLADSSYHVKAVTRNTTSSKAQALASRHPNVGLISANLNDVSSLVSAFQGATHIFGVTDSWTLYADPAVHAKAAESDKPALEVAFDLEVQQGKNIFDAAAQTSGLQRLIFSGLSNATKWSGGKYKYILDFDSKAVAIEYAKEKYPELWAKTSVIQVGFYLENFLGHPLLQPTKKDGEYVFTIPGDRENKVPLVAATIETGTITKALTDQPAGKNVVAYRELTSFENFVEIWAEVLGVKASVERSEVGLGQIDEALARMLREMFDYIAEYGYWGFADMSVIHPKDLGVQFGSVEDWIREQDWSAVLGA